MRFIRGLLGVVGELLISAGVLLLLFTVWQLWWTDVMADREQQEILADLDWVVTIDKDDVAPADDGLQPGEGPPPVPEYPDHHTTIATMHIPRFGQDYVRNISEGVELEPVLNRMGIGHYPETALPGEIGNFSMAGHRTTYGKPFNQVAELEVGDPIIVQTPEVWYVYRVTDDHIVLPHQVEVIAPVPNEPGEVPTERSITLTACHPMFSARERFIVHGEFDRWYPNEGPGGELPPELFEGIEN